MTAADAAGVLLNLFGFFGAGAFLLFNADERRRTPVGVRLSAAVTLLMTLVLTRSLRWAFDHDMAGRLENALAALTPLFALVLAEGLMRRHAPARAKRFVLAASIALAVLALVRPGAADLIFLVLLGVFVAGGILYAALLLAFRDRASLAPSENDAIGAVGLAMLLAAPLAATDFLAAAGLAPLRMGGLGFLVFVFALARLGVTGRGAGALLGDLAIALVASGAAFLSLVVVLGPPSLALGASLAALVFGLVLVILIIEALRARALLESRTDLMRTLAAAPLDSQASFLESITGARALRAAHLLEGGHLADYDTPRLRELIARQGVFARSDLGAFGEAGEVLSVLMDTHDATHAVAVSSSPPRLLLLRLSAIGAGNDLETELALLHKLAQAAGTEP